MGVPSSTLGRESFRWSGSGVRGGSARYRDLCALLSRRRGLFGGGDAFQAADPLRGTQELTYAVRTPAGLVQYALSHGQPVNSILSGVLPLHAAASSGNETVVRMLIEAGADVNSPRLSRRFTREGSKERGVSVGTQGARRSFSSRSLASASH